MQPEEREELLLLAGSLRRRLIETAEGVSWSRFILTGVEAVPFGEETVEMPAGEGVSRGRTLEEIQAELGDCRRCGLHETRRNIVFGEGNPKAEVVFVGEAPGEQEDRQGKPFVGRAGQLLTKIIEAMGLSREDVYICNILKCRPPGNRNPRPEEIEVCEPFLKDQIRAIRPRVICAMGSFAARTLLKREAPISVLRGNFHSYEGIPLMPTYHPAYLLRNAGAKRLVWDDVRMIMSLLEDGGGTRESIQNDND
ncbi:MAG TPA: uracil-DNA glycosylase [Deltaproteobacteria bacterium]|nr:uracil-DNA glycosylase [Deltaproteobacteria bacterium]